MNKIEYMGNGQTKTFAINFPIFDKNDVCVYLNGKMQSAGFTVNYTENGDNANIPYTCTNVQFTNAPKSTDLITITRKIQLTRVVDYQPTVPIDTNALNHDMNFMLEALKDQTQALDDFDDKYNQITDLQPVNRLIEQNDAILTDLNNRANVTMTNLNANGRHNLCDMVTPTSTNYIDVELGADGASYTPPANGYMIFIKRAGAVGEHIQLESCGLLDIRMSATTTQILTVFMPVRKGEKCWYGYNASGALMRFRFLYMKGEL